MRHTQRLIMTYARTCSTSMRSTLLAPALALAACSEDGPAGQAVTRERPPDRGTRRSLANATRVLALRGVGVGAIGPGGTIRLSRQGPSGA